MVANYTTARKPNCPAGGASVLHYHACCVRVCALTGLRDFNVGGASVRSVLSSELEKPASSEIVCNKNNFKSKFTLHFLQHVITPVVTCHCTSLLHLLQYGITCYNMLLYLL